jgi:hypothetical protein
MGKYRWRTRARQFLPFFLIGLAPKGKRDCGEHDWYRQSADTYRCYHCEVGIKRV